MKTILQKLVDAIPSQPTFATPLFNHRTLESTCTKQICTEVYFDQFWMDIDIEIEELHHHVGSTQNIIQSLKLTIWKDGEAVVLSDEDYKSLEQMLLNKSW